MINLYKLLTSDAGKYFVSIILALGITSLFRRACEDRTCIRFSAPEPEKIDGKTYEYDGKCYQYRAVAKPCDPTHRRVKYPEMDETKATASAVASSGTSIFG
jgi:hypothetical protein